MPERDPQFEKFGVNFSFFRWLLRRQFSVVRDAFAVYVWPVAFRDKKTFDRRVVSWVGQEHAWLDFQGTVFQCGSPIFQASKGSGGNRQKEYQHCLTAVDMLASPVHQTGDSVGFY